MHRTPAPVLFLSAIVLWMVAALPAPALAADRTVGIGSFSRLRVDGAFDTRVVVGGSPRATISGDADVIGTVEIRSDGNTVTVRRTVNGTWSERPRAVATTPIIVTLGTPSLTSAVVIGGARVAVDRMAAPRVDLSITGTGGLTVGAVTADAVNVQVIGAGSVTVAGKAATARLMTNGPGTIDAAALDSGDAVVRLDGLGTTAVHARYTAQVNSTGLGSVTVTGTPKCTVRALAGSPVTCGVAASPR